MRNYILYDVFSKPIELCLQLHGHFIETFWSDLINERAEMYAEDIHVNGASLDSCCLRVLDDTKIQMNRPGGPDSIQREAYSEHKMFPCLVYQIITTTDGLIFYRYRPEEGTLA